MTAFEDFIAWQARVHREDPAALLLGETRISRALGAPEVVVPASFPTVHRCDLSRAWCTGRNLPAAWAPRALVCRGVRDALRRLFGQLARRGELIAIPRDVYPVYARIAADAHVETIELATFPDLDVARLLATCEARHILLPCPLKLHGRAWTRDELAAAARWLAADPARRLVLDGVYAFGEPLAPGVLELIATDQVIYLDSLSKGWLHAQVFGAAIVPARDVDALAPVFRDDPPSQASLYTARALLATATPERVASQLAALRARVTDALATRGLVAPAPTRGYLIPVPLAADVAYAAHGVVLVPFAAFGGAGAWSFASALSLASAP